MLSAPGNMVIAEGEDRTRLWLATSSERVDDWLYELVDETIFFAAERLGAHAPGSIDQLVSVALPHSPSVGAIEGTAGVEPDITEETFGRGLGSDPADWPVFVDVGTGIFGERHTPIQTIPGHVMGPFEYQGRMVYARSIRGQRPQHFSDRAFDDTVAWFPMHVELKLPDLGDHS